MVQYQLKPSLTILCINVLLYLLAALALLVYYPINFISVLLFVLIILVFLNDLSIYWQTCKLPAEILLLNLSSGLIERRLSDDKRQFTEYSVYTCRWGVILVLKQSKCKLHLILLADRFKNDHEYLDIRYQLLRLNQAIHAS